MPSPGSAVTFTDDLSLLSRLLGHPVVGLERERAPMMDLERITAVVLAPDRAIPLPPNNVLRNLGEVAELRALLEGWSRQEAETLKGRVRARDLEASPEALEAARKTQPGCEFMWQATQHVFDQQSPFDRGPVPRRFKLPENEIPRGNGLFPESFTAKYPVDVPIRN